MTSSLERARAAFARREWAAACDGLTAAAEQSALGAEDCERLAVSAFLVGRDEQCEQAWESAHRAASNNGDPATAGRYAFWLALCLILRGQMAQAGGWLARATRSLEDAGPDCAESGYLLIPAVLHALDEGDPVRARDLAVQATELGDGFDDADLRAFGTLGHGQALLAMGDIVAGASRLDEVMVSVTCGEVGPITSGIVYCAVLIECMERYDLARAKEWTGAFSAWCEAQPDLVPYRGQCLVHRSQLQAAAGDWPDAIATVESACLRLTDPPHPSLGMARYQEGELHRLIGEFDSADAAYRDASRHGHHPMPGLALLELARGDVAAAAITIRSVLQESSNPAETPGLLAAAVDILRAAGDIAGARQAADELAEVASVWPSPVLAAMSAHATGAVLAAEGDPVAGLVQLRTAARSWAALGMPYEAARTGVLIGLACVAHRDRTAAALELDNARATFEKLGARPDLDRLDTLARGLLDAPSGGADTGLSDREREVLAHVAAGETNREIASALLISQHTVGRHVENIFAKLGVTSRAAATAYAYQHGLVSGSDTDI